MKKQTMAIIALVIAQIFWGASYLMSDFALQTFPAATLVSIRISIAAIVLGIVGLASKQLQKIELKDWKYFLLASFAEPFIYFLCEAESLNHVSPTIASVMLSFIPLLTPVFAFFVLREKVTLMNILGIVISVVGVLMIILDGGKLSADVIGILLLFVGVIASIVYTLVLRKIPEKYNTLTVVFFMFCTSLLFFVPTMLVREMSQVVAIDWTVKTTWDAFGAIVGLALSASCIAFLFFSYGVRTIGPTRANVFNNIQPGVTAILAWVIGAVALYQTATQGMIDKSFFACVKEAAPEWIMLMGIVVVVAGMFISQMNVKQQLLKFKVIMLSKIIKEDSIVQSRRFIDNANKILLTGHISPDGDSLGATLGLYHLLKQLGKDVTVMVPNRYPSFFNWMPGIDKVFIMEENKTEAVKIIKESDVIFCIDYNTLDRVNGMKPLIEQSKAKKVMIDHHLDPNINCDVVISHPEISSASELVFRFMCRMGFYQEVSLESAECIYTGMMTDTGGFTYNSNNPEIYIIIKALLEKGVDKDAIYNKVFHTYSEDRLRLLGYCLNKMEIIPECNAAIIVLTQEELHRFNYKVGDTEGIVNMPLQIENVNKSVLVREDKTQIKLSFRSQGDVAVNIMAEQFGGGGHKNAAGGESTQSMAETLDKLRRVLINA
ncbi:MAG: EamA family transporter [Paludibacteraceae bacterium]|nr:EamA family transporter [Paludibacteraceae bacterium]